MLRREGGTSKFAKQRQINIQLYSKQKLNAENLLEKYTNWLYF